MALGFSTRMVGPVFYVSLVGTVDATNVCEVYDTALRACLDGGCTLMLLDALGAEGGLTTVDRFDLGKFVAERNTLAQGGLGAAVRVALVAHPPLADPSRFGALVANNRGALVTVTAGVDEALRWFGVAPPASPPLDGH
ncbi:MAG TPA: hypothetical protein VFJ16_23890 [Longimicrobium sp.]|nr:hypothetical protein [Longimicrobium sp.]